MKLILTLCLMATCAVAQTNEKPKPDSFRGLEIDVATPDDVITALGKPNEDELDRIKVQRYDTQLLVDKQAERVFRLLYYKTIPSVRRVQ